MRFAQRRKRNDRRGTTTVEAAFVLPVFFLFVFGVFQLGHAQMVSNMLKSAARNGARLGATEGVPSDQVVDRVRDILSSAIDPNQVTVMVKDGSLFDDGGAVPSGAGDYAALPDIELSDAGPRQLFIVRVSVPYNEVSVLPMGFLKNVVLSGQAVMRHE